MYTLLHKAWTVKNTAAFCKSHNILFVHLYFATKNRHDKICTKYITSKWFY